jgi:hypothetical protein
MGVYLAQTWYAAMFSNHFIFLYPADFVKMDKTDIFLFCVEVESIRDFGNRYFSYY